MEKITAQIKIEDGVTAQFNEPSPMTARANQLIITTGEAAEYDGPYRATPEAWEEVTLKTKNKMLSDNITVEKVPYFEVGNETGNTVYIAMESEVI